MQTIFEKTLGVFDEEILTAFAACDLAIEKNLNPIDLICYLFSSQVKKCHDVMDSFLPDYKAERVIKLFYDLKNHEHKFIIPFSWHAIRNILPLCSHNYNMKLRKGLPPKFLMKNSGIHARVDKTFYFLDCDPSFYRKFREITFNTCYYKNRLNMEKKIFIDKLKLFLSTVDLSFLKNTILSGLKSKFSWIEEKSDYLFNYLKNKNVIFKE
jgi:hypothetical protein